MRWDEISSQGRSDLLARRDSGELVEEMAAELNMRPTTLSRRLRELSANINGKRKRIRKPRVERKRWDDPPIFRGDAMVTGDFHLPYLDYKFAEQMLEAAEIILEPPRRLIVAGDLFNMDAFSPFPPVHTYRATFEEELAAAHHFMHSAKEVFTHIDALLGNHERRLFKQVLGHLSTDDLELLVDVDGVEFYPYAWGILKTQTGDWRLTHQANYSRNAQSVGIQLAHKFRMHIITHHQHKVSMGYDKSGKSVVIDNGCMADPMMLDFVQAIDNTAPVMNQGFTIIRNGAATVFTNDSTFTDWGIILGRE